MPFIGNFFLARNVHNFDAFVCWIKKKCCLSFFTRFRSFCGNSSLIFVLFSIIVMSQQLNGTVKVNYDYYGSVRAIFINVLCSTWHKSESYSISTMLFDFFCIDRFFVVFFSLEFCSMNNKKSTSIQCVTKDNKNRINWQMIQFYL